MSHHRGTAALVVAALLVCCASCVDSPVTPEELSAAQTRPDRASMDERELLLAVLTKLDDLESRFEGERTVIFSRLDSLAASAGVAFPADSTRDGREPPPKDPETDRRSREGELQSSDVRDIKSYAERTLYLADSIMALVDFVARDVAEPWQGLEVCGSFEISGEGELKGATKAEGEGKAGVGVKPLESGAAANAKLSQRVEVEFTAGAEFGVGLEGCVDLTNIGLDPPVRPSTAGSAPARAPGGSLQASIRSLADRLGLDEQSLERATADGTAIFESGDFSRLVNLATILPLPNQARDPLGLVRDRVADFDPVDLLCGGTSFGGRIGDYASEGCQYIVDGDLPELGPFKRAGENLADLTDRFSDLGDNFSDLSDDFEGLSDRFGSLCGRFNDVVDRRLVIDTDLPWGGSNTINMRLFPAAWGVPCE